MTKAELASYLVNLIVIMESKEDAGRPRGETLANEYNRCYDQFRQLLDQETSDEPRQREFRPWPGEARTDPSRGVPGRSESVGGNGGASEGSGTDVLRKRL